MIPSQMLKGMLEGCVLKVISDSETYGYEISQRLKIYGFGEISEGTIYPMLLRMEKNGYICADYRESAAGPRRKYFTVTEKGEAELNEFRERWQELESAVRNLFGTDVGENQRIH